MPIQSKRAGSAADTELGAPPDAAFGRLFELRFRGRSSGGAFVDIGDQLSAFMRGSRQHPDRARHIGLVVDDKEAVRRRLEVEGVARGGAFRACRVG